MKGGGEKELIILLLEWNKVFIVMVGGGCKCFSFSENCFKMNHQFPDLYTYIIMILLLKPGVETGIYPVAAAGQLSQ